MASVRPKRSRKIVNYGEDHLHWIEENQIQKALLRSLYDRESPHKVSSRASLSHENPQETVLACETGDDVECFHEQSRVVSASTCSDMKVDHTEGQHSIENSMASKSIYVKDTVCKPEDNFELRLTRLQSKLLEEHGIFAPSELSQTSLSGEGPCMTSKNDCQVSLKDFALDKKLQCTAKQNPETCESVQTNGIQGKRSPRKILFPVDVGVTHFSSSKSVETGTQKIRAQRKFASNPSPSKSRSCSPVKMHRNKPSTNWNGRRVTRQKRNMPRALRACSSEGDDQSLVTEHHAKKGCTSSEKCGSSKSYPQSVFRADVKTDTFLSYLCFRNSHMKFEI